MQDVGPLPSIRREERVADRCDGIWATKTFGPGNQATKTFGPGNQATKSPLTFTINACPAQICWQLYTSIPETVKDIFTSCKRKMAKHFCGDTKTFYFTWNAFFWHRAQSSEFRRVPNFTNIWSHEGMKSLLIKRPHDWLTNAGTWKLQIRYSAFSLRCLLSPLALKSFLPTCHLGSTAFANQDRARLSASYTFSKKSVFFVLQILSADTMTGAQLLGSINALQ